MFLPSIIGSLGKMVGKGNFTYIHFTYTRTNKNDNNKNHRFTSIILNIIVLTKIDFDGFDMQVLYRRQALVIQPKR